MRSREVPAGEESLPHGPGAELMASCRGGRKNDCVASVMGVAHLRAQVRQPLENVNHLTSLTCHIKVDECVCVRA